MTPKDDEANVLDRTIAALRPVAGLRSIVLGGSRARGTNGPDSDYDLGLYYDGDAPLDIGALQAAIAPIVDDPDNARVTAIGEWGPWINGGGWLRISGRKVDLLYRDIRRVRGVIDACSAGRISMDYQPGHPYGFCSAIWMGEIALCRPLLDDGGAIADLKARATPYPDALAHALIHRFSWEIGFSVDNAEKAVARADATHLAGCAYRALCCLAQTIFALNRRYLINEKGAIAEAATLPLTIADLTTRVDQIWRAVGGDLARAIIALRRLADDAALLVAASQPS